MTKIMKIFILLQIVSKHVFSIVEHKKVLLVQFFVETSILVHERLGVEYQRALNHGIFHLVL